MILKNLTRRSGTHQLLSYLFEKDRNAGERKPLIIRHNIRSHTSLSKWVKEFDQNESYRLRKRKDNVKIHHTILSISNKDTKHVTDKMLRDITRKYIALRGRQNMYLGTAHFEKDHIHIHIVSSGVEYITGKSNRISRSEFSGVKRALDDFQKIKYPELVNSLPQHGKSKGYHITAAKHDFQGNSRESHKQTLLNVLQKAYTEAVSLDHFLSQIKAFGHEPYYRAGRLQGIKFNGVTKFRISRLGFDKEKIQQLIELKTKEKQAMSELQNLRLRNIPDRGRAGNRYQRDIERAREK